MKRYRLACVAVLVLAGALTASAQKAPLTSHAAMLSKLASMEVVDSEYGHGRLNVVSIGKSVKGKDIPLVVIRDPDTPVELTKRLFVITRQHGDEPAGTEAMLSLIEDLTFLSDPETADLLKKVSFFIVPMVNPDGADKYQRRNANGADLNRDWLQQSQPEIRCVRAAIDAVAPDVLIDAHELSPGNTRGDFVETAGPTCGASPDLVAESARIQDLVVGMLRTHDIQVRSYQIGDQHPARLAHRYFPIHGSTKTFLFETRQAGVRQYQLQYRMKLHIVGTMTIAKYLAGLGDDLRQRIVQYDQRRWVQMASRGKKRSEPTKKK